MVDLVALTKANEKRWKAMRVNQDRISIFDAQARKLIEPSVKARYVGVTERLRQAGVQPVPWWFIAIVSVREYGGPPRWDRQLGQGDPLDQVSTHEPVGRGPFLSHPGDVTPGNDAWTRGCLDALIDCAPHAAKWADWTAGGVMTLFEAYNGYGYANRGVPSAYVWSGSDQYVSGKYVRDHVYDPDAVDVQLGCAPLLARMMALDSTIAIGLPAAPSEAPEIVLPPPGAKPSPDLAPTFWGRFLDLFKSKRN